MSLGVVIGYKQVPGSNFSVTAVVSGDTAYPNPGGYVVNAATFGLTVLRKLILNQFTTIGGAAYELALVPTYNADGVTLASVAIHFIVGTTGVEVANNVNVSAASFQVTAEGN